MGSPVPIAFASNQRTGFPQAVALNYLSEKSPTKPTTVDAMIARAGLVAFLQVGNAPIRGVFAKAGLLSDQAFIVAQNTAYLVSVAGVITALTGTIAGDALVDIDGGLGQDEGQSIIRIANGSALYKFDSLGTTVVQEDFPSAGGAGATSVQFWSGYWVAVEAGTDFFYWQEPASSTWTALEFAAAEYAPDPLKGIRILGDQAFLLGSATTEPWYLTGDASDPMLPTSGLKFDIGCRNLFTAINCKGSLVWVTDDSSVVMSDGGAPRIISDNGLAEQIRRTAAADLSAGFFVKDQHPCYVLHLGTTATWVYDLSSGRWCNFGSLGFDYWRPLLFANLGDVVICSDRNSNQVWKLDPDAGTDAGDAIVKEFYAFLEVAEGNFPLGNVEIDCLRGDAPTSNPDDESIMVLEISRDEGASWSSPRQRGLGERGRRMVRPRWNGLGQIPAPGGILKFTTSCEGRMRVSGVRANVP
jgi:hypothetical protein